MSSQNQLVATAAVVVFTGALIWTLSQTAESQPPTDEQFFLDDDAEVRQYEEELRELKKELVPSDRTGFNLSAENAAKFDDVASRAELLAKSLSNKQGSTYVWAKRIADEVAGLREKWKAQLEEAKSAGPIHPVWISHCIDRIKGDNPIIIKESGIQLQHLNITETDTVFTGGAGGGLGYGLGTALGAKLAAPDRLVICTQGDGAYHYGNPVPSHYVAKAEGLPMLTVVFNNARWDAVRRNTRAVYPDGYASRSNREPLTYFEPGVAYEHAVEVVGGYGECVEDPEELPRALDRAMDAIESEDRQALLNVITA